MDLNLLKTFGEVAAPAGLAIGAFLYIARGLIAKNIFPILTKEQAYKIVFALAFMAWTTALAGIVSWTYVTIHTPSKQEMSSEAKVLWEKNWLTVNDPRPYMGSSEGYAATNRERLLDLLKALELSSAPSLDNAREQLVSDIEKAPGRPEDTTYNMVISAEIEAKLQSLKRSIRDQALSAGATLGNSR